jgi:hypothetical protein
VRKLALVLAVLAALVAVASASANGPLDTADLDYLHPTAGGKCESFGVGAPGGWGGRGEERAVVAGPQATNDDLAYCTFEGLTAKARHIELEVLDGLANDSFKVYVKNPAGIWVEVYSYADQYATEIWVTHHIYSFPAGKGQGNTVEIMIELTGPHWSGFSTFGQLAVDYIKIYEH